MGEARFEGSCEVKVQFRQSQKMLIRHLIWVQVLSLALNSPQKYSVHMSKDDIYVFTLPFKWFVFPFESWTEVTAGETIPLKNSIFLSRDRQELNIRPRPSSTWGLTPHCGRKNPKEYSHKRKIYFYKCISLPNSLIMWSLRSWWIGPCFSCPKDLVDKNCKWYLWMMKSKMESSLSLPHPAVGILLITYV